MNNTRTLFKYFGSKWRLMNHLIHLMPNHRQYVSVFGGGGGDIINKPRSRQEIYNDLNEDVVNIFTVIQEPGQQQELIDRLEASPRSRRMFERNIDLIKSGEGDSVKRAAAFIYCSAYGVGNEDPAKRYYGSFCVVAHRSHSYPETVRRVTRRFAQVLIECRSWEHILNRYDTPDTLFYCDPPYVQSTRKKNTYRHEFSDDDHVRLLTQLKGVQGLVMLSGYPSDLYDELLPGWNKHEIRTVAHQSPKKVKPPRTEVVWMNYRKDGSRIEGVSNEET